MTSRDTAKRHLTPVEFEYTIMFSRHIVEQRSVRMFFGFALSGSMSTMSVTGFLGVWVGGRKTSMKEAMCERRTETVFSNSIGRNSARIC